MLLFIIGFIVALIYIAGINVKQQNKLKEQEELNRRFDHLQNEVNRYKRRLDELSDRDMT